MLSIPTGEVEMTESSRRINEINARIKRHRMGDPADYLDRSELSELQDELDKLVSDSVDHYMDQRKEKRMESK